MLRCSKYAITEIFRSNLIGLALPVLCLSFFLTIDQANAQDETGLKDSTDSAGELANQGGDALSDKYEDVAREYGGFRRSPILFGKNTNGGTQHPGLSLSGMDVGLNPLNEEKTGIYYQNEWALNGLGGAALDLSVDDEISKSSMAIFQSMSGPGAADQKPDANGNLRQTIQDSFLQNEAARDSYLDTFKTARGIAIMTLSYLDKTVAAGLATSQSQADSDAIQQQLKQMNNNIAKIANPEKARLFEDADEKFEACMEGAGFPGKKSAEKDPVIQGQEKPLPVVFDAYTQCQLNRDPADTSPAFCGGMKSYQSSKYHFCGCCAENSSFANLSTVTPLGAKNKVFYGEGYSLVDRMFLGLTVPNGQLRLEATTTDAKQSDKDFDAGRSMLDFSTMVRSLYGDILFAPKFSGVDNSKSTSRDGTKSNKLTIKLTTPLLSIQQWVRAVRDFSEVKKVNPYSRALSFNSGPGSKLEESCHWEQNEGMWLRYCPTFGGALKWGVCPALKQLIQLEKDNQLTAYTADSSGAISAPDGTSMKKDQAVAQMWSEASLGGVLLSRADLTTMTELEGTADGDRIIAAFCDTSAVEAVKRLHRKVTTLANDMLAANRKATQQDKSEILSLFKRADDQLKLGTEDSRSKVDELLLALDMQRDRRREALRSSLVATGNASERQAKRVGLLFRTFGGPYPN